MAELTKRGLPPVHGGALDQAKKFLDACTFVWTETARIKAELKLEAFDG